MKKILLGAFCLFIVLSSGWCDKVDPTATLVDKLTIKESTTKPTSLPRGGSYQLNVEITPATASKKVTWASKTPTVASVNSSGLVTIAPDAPLGKQTITITATSNDGSKKTATFTFDVTVTPATDTTPPTLSKGSVTRTSNTAATIGFTTNEAGTAYYLVKDNGAAAPTSAQVKAGTSLGAVAAAAITDKAVTLTAGAKDIYVVVVDAAGNISSPLKIAAAAYSTTKVATPGASPGAGAVASGQEITLSCATSGANIRYTTNGSNPTATSGTLYSASAKPKITAATTLKVIAYKDGMTISDILTVAYTITGATTKVAKPTVSPAAGAVASGTEITLSCTTSGANIRYTTNGSDPSATSGTLYSASAKPKITAATTLKVIAYKDGMTISDILTVAYTITGSSSTTDKRIKEILITSTETGANANKAKYSYTPEGALKQLDLYTVKGSKEEQFFSCAFTNGTDGRPSKAIFSNFNPIVTSYSNETTYTYTGNPSTKTIAKNETQMTTAVSSQTLKSTVTTTYTYTSGRLTNSERITSETVTQTITVMSPPTTSTTTSTSRAVTQFTYSGSQIQTRVERYYDSAGTLTSTSTYNYAYNSDGTIKTITGSEPYVDSDGKTKTATVTSTFTWENGKSLYDLYNYGY